MKKCTNCGLENLDEATRCETCNMELTATVPETHQPQPTTPLDERRFWDRMNLRQFAVFFMRLQAVWLLFYAVVELTHIPLYVGTSYTGGLYIHPGARLGFFLLLLRIILYVATALAVIQYADRLVSWLVRDWVRNQSAGGPTAPANPVPPVPGAENNPKSAT